MTDPTLTVCIPNYNHGRFIGQALESVLSQSVPATEIIVIDDASTDDSIAVIERYAQEHPSIRLITKPSNKGVFDSVAAGLSLAQGEYFYLLAADDHVLPGFFERTISLLREHPKAGMCAVALKFIDPHGAEIPRENLPAFHTHLEDARDAGPLLDPAAVLKRLERQPWFLGGVSAVMFRRAAFAEAGGLVGELGLYADWFAPHYVALKYGMCYASEPLSAFRIMPNSFGSAIVMRPRVSFEQAAATLHRMEEPQYASIFPRWFIEQKRRDFTYSSLRGALVNWQTTFLADVSELVPRRGIMARALFALLRLTRNLQWLLLKIYCRGRVAVPLQPRGDTRAR